MEALDLGALMGKEEGTQVVGRQNDACKSLEAWGWKGMFPRMAVLMGYVRSGR